MTFYETLIIDMLQVKNVSRGFEFPGMNIEILSIGYRYGIY